MFGFLNVNKPSGISSHKVISLLRKITGIKQIGHAGTLDPSASGVLPVAIGKATKLIEYMSDDKAYIVSMYLGKVSDSYDTDGVVEDTGADKVSIETIRKILPEFTGEISQIPPAFSAVHYNGKRLYELARKGVIPDDIPSRLINVYKNEIIDFDYENQILKLYIECSKGTYIRTIVNDIGCRASCGAVMFELIRTKSSGFDIKDSFIPDENTTKDDVLNKIVNPKSVLPLETVEIDEKSKQKLVNGNRFELQSDKRGLVLVSYNGKVIALGESSGMYIVPKKVLL